MRIYFSVFSLLSAVGWCHWELESSLFQGGELEVHPDSSNQGYYFLSPEIWLAKSMAGLSLGKLELFNGLGGEWAPGFDTEFFLDGGVGLSQKVGWGVIQERLGIGYYKQYDSQEIDDPPEKISTFFELKINRKRAVVVPRWKYKIQTISAIDENRLEIRHQTSIGLLWRSENWSLEPEFGLRLNFSNRDACDYYSLRSGMTVLAAPSPKWYFLANFLYQPRFYRHSLLPDIQTRGNSKPKKKGKNPVTIPNKAINTLTQPARLDQWLIFLSIGRQLGKKMELTFDFSGFFHILKNLDKTYTFNRIALGYSYLL